ncbi:MAG: FCD domain-containing protein [Actinobacteria bacterium]|nr:FCD domain-containing protein [Actinomycetota bacterium]
MSLHRSDRELLARTRAAKVADLLRTRIQGGELAPGDQLLPEREFAEQLGVARPTLRQALKILQEEGFVRSERGAGGGTFVDEFDVPREHWVGRIREDVSDFEDVLDLRHAIETRAAALAATRRDDQDLKTMERALVLLLAASNEAQFRQADSLFHNALAEASRSPRLATAIRNARGELFFPADQANIEISVRDHSAVFEAVRAQDPAEAARLMGVHIEHGRAVLHEIALGSADHDRSVESRAHVGGRLRP